jgi:hypothetical protein
MLTLPSLPPLLVQTLLQRVLPSLSNSHAHPRNQPATSHRLRDTLFKLQLQSDHGTLTLPSLPLLLVEILPQLLLPQLRL